MLKLIPLNIAQVGLAVAYVREYYAHDGLEFGPHVDKAIKQLLSTPQLGTFFAVDVDGKSSGYVVMTFGFDHEYGGRFGLITDFFLKENIRGQGVGSSVIRLLEQEASDLGLDAIELVVLEHNARGKKFYITNGFEPVTDRLEMRKAISVRTSSSEQNS